MCTPSHWKLGGGVWLGTVAPPHAHFLRCFFSLSEKTHQIPRSTWRRTSTPRTPSTEGLRAPFLAEGKEEQETTAVRKPTNTTHTKKVVRTSKKSDRLQSQITPTHLLQGYGLYECDICVCMFACVGVYVFEHACMHTSTYMYIPEAREWYLMPFQTTVPWNVEEFSLPPHPLPSQIGSSTICLV